MEALFAPPRRARITGRTFLSIPITSASGSCPAYLSIMCSWLSLILPSASISSARERPSFRIRTYAARRDAYEPSISADHREVFSSSFPSGFRIDLLYASTIAR